MRENVWKQMMDGPVSRRIWVILMLGLLCHGCGEGEASRRANQQPGHDDLVVFIAKEKPQLYRLVGTTPVPWGAAKFHSPISIVADPKRKCFFVLDQPQYIYEPFKVWRIDVDGTASVIYLGQRDRDGQPFTWLMGLSLDREGRPLVTDGSSGLWRLENNGRMQRLFDGKTPFRKITAAASHPSGGILIASGYQHDVTGGRVLDERAGHTAPIGILKSQGGLYLADVLKTPVQIGRLLENRRAGGPEYDTFWRSLRQVFVDDARRIVLVDEGSKKTSRHEEKEYIPKYPIPPDKSSLEYKRWTRRQETKHPLTRVTETESVILGGMFVLHPSGRLEDLTFKTPTQSCGMLRRPRGAAQWSADTYIVADPEMYVEGVNGTGGLFLLKLDGAREARAAFGYRIKPCGVSILRQVGNLRTPSALPLQLRNLTGVHRAGQITKIASVSLERQTRSPYSPGSPLYGLGRKWEGQSRDQAVSRLRSLFEGARWEISADGTLLFSAGSLDPRQPGHLLVLSGRVKVNRELVLSYARHRAQSNFDLKVVSVDAMMHCPKPGELAMSVEVTVFTDNERLKGEFEQTLVIESGTRG